MNGSQIISLNRADFKAKSPSEIADIVRQEKILRRLQRKEAQLKPKQQRFSYTKWLKEWRKEHR